ncbi:hypothetical protein M0R88_12985 [Halorussus gelatinilyticus]|uniref:DUF7344 domain-containing protein n=1 Tax=Halorussus gelatinilyticus TaxID=2937524 RepID=A0A8U0IFB4_9EURY|nr:hypothetical protein [Halorussus gelatinilyticus]UPV99434.1 hypothetical protein M0R88_12985 [Halorussus gelatinilyticus]
MAAETLHREDRDEANEPTDGAAFSQEVVFEMLSNSRRRYVVHYLLDNDRDAELRDLARAVAAWENDKRPDEVTSQERRRVYNALQQAHLPKMDDAGLVAFDASRGTVVAADGLADLRVYLEIVPGDEISWSQYYFLLGAFFGSMTLASLVGVDPFGAVPGVALAGAFALVLVASAAAHVYHDRKMRLGADERPPSA